ncbi:MAG: hypothetical protein PF487_04770 [Bacteroidales bacterium]|jgi:hypothetical protein|nr:hypothetical protein [Bacteroidales bacterium]
MKRYLLVILIISFSFDCFTQNPEYIDSLLRVYNNIDNNQDFETLNKIQKYYIDYSPEKAIKYAKELYYLSESDHNLKFMELSSLVLGEAYFYFV